MQIAIIVLMVAGLVALVAGLLVGSTPLLIASLAISVASIVLIVIAGRRLMAALPKPGTKPGTQPGTQPGTPAADAVPQPSRAAVGDADDEPPPAAPIAQPGDVWVIDARLRYHLATCEFLRGKDAEPIPLAEALAGGFTPCSLCDPPQRVL